MRTEFWRLVRDGGAERTDRIPTREDLHARHHWYGESLARRLRARGRDPGRPALGRASPLIQGTTDTVPRLRMTPGSPLPDAVTRARPCMPLAWFDTPAARAVFSPPDPDHVFLETLAARHLAGLRDRPRGTDVHRLLTVGPACPEDAGTLNDLLAGMAAADYPLHDTYLDKQRMWLLSLSDFVIEVGKRQAVR